ncbi:MAG TPA: TIGR03089 family protein [Mycobacteriales bacterium]|nr:TIGR03089 family protein [Mycobacteriales bacterium]
MATPASLLESELRRDGARPLITAYDGDGNRVELSVTTVANWVAKTAGYLMDELGLEPGDPLAIDPTLHWLTAVALLAGWTVGAEVRPESNPDAARLEVPLDPMGAGFSRVVAAYPDRYVPSSPSGQAEVAAAPDLPAGARVLTTLPLDDLGIGLGLLGPLAAGGSAVFATGPGDLEAMTAAERVTHTAGVDVAGLPRLG